MGNRVRKMSYPDDKKIVVVGGGYAGSALSLRLLQCSANFLLIDSRDAMHHNMAAVRAVAVPGFASKILLSYKPTFGDNFKQGKVNNIIPESKVVILENGEQIDYDTLVIATGTTGCFPCKMTHLDKKDAMDMYENLAAQVKDSQNIAVIGGGAAGVELASEIAINYPDKNITLIHANKDLVNYPHVKPHFQEQLVAKLNSHNVKVILDEKVANLNEIADGGTPGTIITESGKEITSDLILKSIGLKINKEAYEGTSLLKENNGALKVDEFLRVEGHEDIFSIGDCNNVPENKLAFLAEKQAWVVAGNIEARYLNNPPQTYHPGRIPLAIVLALGHKIGMAQLSGGKILPEFLANNMKARDLFIGSYWKKFSQSPPQLTLFDKFGLLGRAKSYFLVIINLKSFILISLIICFFYHIVE